MCLNPLLCTLVNSLHGLRIGRRRARTSVVAYADDVTIFVTAPTDIQKLQETIHCYEAASGARVNIEKSRAIAFGTCNKSIDIMNIPYHDTATILGFQIKNTVRESALASWTKTTANIRAQAQDAYCRMLTLDERIQFVHEYLLARAWYVSQIYPPPDVCVRQLNTTISWFVWKGDIFCVPLSTVYRTKERGGWDLTNLSAKSHALLLYRMRQHVMKQGTITSALIADMWPKCERSQLAISGCHSRKFRISEAFCDGFGLCGRTRAYGVQACIQKKIIQYLVPHK